MTAAALASAHQQFEAALPAIHRSVRYLLRHRRRDRDELLAELTARCWETWHNLLERGRDPQAVGITAIAAWAARHALKGRRIGNCNGGGRSAMDVQNKKAGCTVLALDDRAVGDRRWTPADEAAFRCDITSWLASLPPRRRATAELLSLGHGTGEVARELGISAAAVSQARTWLERSWRTFQGELPAACG